jgi:NAD(P)-dependent dehydrogenase (short-subunit alcohol dehydrogenase family)
MGTLASTASFASTLISSVKSIDYVLLNAGLRNTEHHLSGDGFEETLQVNLLSTALLGILLLPWLKEVGRGKAHLGIVTSGTHVRVKLDGEGIPKEDVLGFYGRKENFPGAGGMYAVSKLFLQYVAFELAKLAVGPDGK